MPSHKEFYDALSNISVNADTLNLNTDQVETKLDTANGILTTLSADTALVKTDIANGVTINQPVAVTDNNESLTVDGTVTALGQDSENSAYNPIPLNAGSTAVKALSELRYYDEQAGIYKTVADGIDTSSGLNPLPVAIKTTVPTSDRGLNGEATVATFNSTSSATLKALNTGRKLLTIFNEGAGSLHVLYGNGTASTTNYSVRVAAGDYLEIEKYTGEVRAIFATAGTARVTEIT